MLGITGRRILLTLHILIVSIWAGGLVAMLALQMAKTGMWDGNRLAALDLAILRIHDWAVVNAAFCIVLTGLAFSLFTHWGAFRFYWVGMKWIVVLTLFPLVMFGVIPSVNGMAALSDAFGEGVDSMVGYAQYEASTVGYVVLELALLLGVIAASVFKPWGRREPKLKIPRWLALGSGWLLAALLILNVWMSATQVRTYRHMPIRNVDVARIADGTYEGRATYGFIYGVRVVVAGGRISEVIVTHNRDSHYAQLAEHIREKVVRTQRINIDGVSGATTTSKALLKAMEDALK